MTKAESYRKRAKAIGKRMNNLPADKITAVSVLDP